MWTPGGENGHLEYRNHCISKQFSFIKIYLSICISIYGIFRQFPTRGGLKLLTLSLLYSRGCEKTDLMGLHNPVSLSHWGLLVGRTTASIQSSTDHLFIATRSSNRHLLVGELEQQQQQQQHNIRSGLSVCVCVCAHDSRGLRCQMMLIYGRNKKDRKKKSNTSLHWRPLAVRNGCDKDTMRIFNIHSGGDTMDSSHSSTLIVCFLLSSPVCLQACLVVFAH